MPRYWMITNRNLEKDSLGKKAADTTYWTSDDRELKNLGAWTKTSPQEFRTMLIGMTKKFPLIQNADEHDRQRHLTLFLHGYNNSWEAAVRRYRSICDHLFDGPESLGICVLFNWPSNGSPADYLPDRADAERSAAALADLLGELYDWLLDKQRDAATNPRQACRAKISIIAHSMGNYLLQRAMHLCWTRKNQPLLVSLINQLAMVAADVDNDLFKSGEAVSKTDGDGIANLTYRVTALYTGRDSVLGASAGLKHFGKRRLGRSGLDRNYPLPDNVWDVDCSSLIPHDAKNVHSAYFDAAPTLALLREILVGTDRTQIKTSSSRQ